MLRTRIRAGTVAGVVLSLVFALFLSALQSFELFIDSWTPELGQTTAVTLRIPYGPRIVRDQHTRGSNISYEHTRITIPAGMLLSAYLRRFGQNRVRLLRTQIGLFAAMLLMTLVVKLMFLFTSLPEFWVP